jgi:uncharacterized membrane-anchored protein YhcB (DUF1043 family)
MTVAETSVQVFQKNREQLNTLKEKTHHSLQEFIIAHGFTPTYNELQQHMTQQYEEITWRTQIQPRLTSDLVEEDKVQKAGKRKCRVSGETIQTWTTKVTQE